MLCVVRRASSKPPTFNQYYTYTLYAQVEGREEEKKKAFNTCLSGKCTVAVISTSLNADQTDRLVEEMANKIQWRKTGWWNVKRKQKITKKKSIPRVFDCIFDILTEIVCPTNNDE